MTAAPFNPAVAADLENTLYMDLEYGRVVIEMRPDLAPKHVTRIKELVRKKFYDGLTFHRVIGGFMAQGGDPDGNGTGGSGVNIPAEVSNEPHVRGTVSMARSSDPNSGDSQFFIVFARSDWLDGQYTVWGQVTDGMEFVGKLKRGSRANNGAVSNPDKIVRMQVAADAN
ncbi:MAG: peptidylprolyl isomerase [Rhodospirillaceae bacterium]